ncbi:unnamed protein product [Menidia menidia]|uniref:(Atlantic silverside) hypothetical protein n=1 Tax=Menidia menidia TaxID=238744 RepID=A0A8S4B147_9TELE|nr:unnamed protein product [Menidia menidia]
MLMPWPLRHLLLAGTCLCVCGAPAYLSDHNQTLERLAVTPGSKHTVDTGSTPSEREGVRLRGGAGGGTGLHGGPEGTDPVTQTANGDSGGGRFGPGNAGGKAWRQRSEAKKTESVSAMGDLDRKNEETPVDGEPLSPTGGGRQIVLASTTMMPHLDSSHSQKSKDGGADGTIQDEDPETSFPPSTEPRYPYTSLWTQTLPSHTSIPPLMVVTSRTSAPLTIWGHDGAKISALPDPILPEIGPNLMPREDALESLWTEAARQAEDTAVPPSLDQATEATMSSEALPLIFEPFEDATAESGAAAAAAGTRVPASGQPAAAALTGGPSEVDLDQLVTVETDSNGPSRNPPVILPDWTSPWQTSGAELLEPITAAGPSVSQRLLDTQPKDRPEKGDSGDLVVYAWRTPSFVENIPSTGPSLSSLQHAMTAVTMATHQFPHKSRVGLEEMESEEEPDEDDENSEESLEEESEENLTEKPARCSTQPSYSLIPPPPVWVQRNQGLSTSTEQQPLNAALLSFCCFKLCLLLGLPSGQAGYVSGMLAPVGIGITGALLIVGALYSIRMIHRKRRNSFKHQRRKQPREPSTSLQDQAMLLADSSEDEF